MDEQKELKNLRRYFEPIDELWLDNWRLSNKKNLNGDFTNINKADSKARSDDWDLIRFRIRLICGDDPASFRPWTVYRSSVEFDQEAS